MAYDLSASNSCALVEVLCDKPVCITECAGLYFCGILAGPVKTLIFSSAFKGLREIDAIHDGCQTHQTNRMPSVKSNRPVNLSLATVIEVNLKSPVAIASILHRLSGVLLFFVIPGLLWLLDCSLSSAEGFACVQAMLTGIVGKLVLFVALAGLAYHFIAGVKHLVMDWGFGESLEGGRTFAKFSLIVSALVIAALFVGVVL